MFHILTTFILRNSLLIVPSSSSNKFKEIQNSGVPVPHRRHYTIVLLCLKNVTVTVKSFLSKQQVVTKGQVVS